MIKVLAVIAAALACAALCLFMLPGLLEGGEYNPYVMKGILFALISIGLANIVKKRYADKGLAPSVFLITFFLLVPPVGCLGYSILVRAGISYFGGSLHFDYPIYLWYLGTMIFSAGLAATHFALGRTTKAARYSWNFPALKGIMVFFIFISAVFTILALLKIGYIPILRGGFDIDRFAYDITAGEYTVKFSRLWLVVFIIAVHIYFYGRKKKYLALMAVSAFCLVIYGNRTYMFIPVVYLFIFYVKQKKLIKARTLVLICALGITLFYLIHQVREGKTAELRDVPAVERMVPFIFGEWREFSYVVNDFDVTKNSFLREKIFLGVMSTVFPKQIWQLFGLEKDKLFPYNAAEYFGRYFGHYAGIRIGIIGECYVGFGVGGVVVIMAILGAIVSLLENLYMTLECNNPILMFVGFVLSIFMLLPLLTFINITSTIVFFGFFIAMVIFFGGRKYATA